MENSICLLANKILSYRQKNLTTSNYRKGYASIGQNSSSFLYDITARKGVLSNPQKCYNIKTAYSYNFYYSYKKVKRCLAVDSKDLINL